VDVRVNFEDKQEMILMLVPLVVAMWGARSRRPVGATSSQHPRPRDRRAACPLHSRINRLEARGRTLDPHEKHFESYGY
jgi:hypothetical protein